MVVGAGSGSEAGLGSGACLGPTEAQQPLPSPAAGEVFAIPATQDSPPPDNPLDASAAATPVPSRFIRACSPITEELLDRLGSSCRSGTVAPPLCAQLPGTAAADGSLQPEQCCGQLAAEPNPSVLAAQSRSCQDAAPRAPGQCAGEVKPVTLPALPAANGASCVHSQPAPSEMGGAKLVEAQQRGSPPVAAAAEPTAELLHPPSNIESREAPPAPSVEVQPAVQPSVAPQPCLRSGAAAGNASGAFSQQPSAVDTILDVTLSANGR